MSSEVAQVKVDKSSGLSTVGRLLGAVGLVLLVSTPLTYMLTEQLGTLVFGKLVLGAVLVGFYLATNADVFSRMAGSRSTGLMVMTVLSVVVVVALVGVVNYLAYKNPRELDLTREGIYTLSEPTRNALGRLQDDVKVYVFLSSQDPNYVIVEETLQRYADASKRFTFEMVNPEARPDLTKKFNVVAGGSPIVVTARGRDVQAKDVSEQELTNAIVKVAEQSSKKVAFLTGHGEGDINASETDEGFKVLSDAVRAEGYTVETLSLLAASEAVTPGMKVKLDKHDKHDAHGPGEIKEALAPQGEVNVSPDIAVLVILGPKESLFPAEVAALERFVAKGGRVIAMLEPDSDAGLSAFLAQWKIKVQNDLVVDVNPMNRGVGLGPVAPITYAPTEQAQHPVVKDLKDTPVIFMSARSLAVAAGGLGGVDAVPLLETGTSAWGETDLTAEEVGMDPKDNVGPVALSIASVREVTEPAKINAEARVVAFGDSQWVNNKFFRAMPANSDMILNTLAWLADEQNRIAIRPKAREASQLFLSGEELGQIKFFSLDILPVLIVAMGLGVVLIRRQR